MLEVLCGQFIMKRDSFFALAFSNLWDRFVIDLWAFALMSKHTYRIIQQTDNLPLSLKSCGKLFGRKRRQIKLITTTYAPAKQIKTGVFSCMLVPVMSHTLA